MADVLESVIRPAPIGFDDLKRWIHWARPDLPANPLLRSDDRYACCEIFGQSTSIRDGFAVAGAGRIAKSFDVRSLSFTGFHLKLDSKKEI